MSDDSIRRAEAFLKGIVGKAILSAEQHEYQLELVFGPWASFIVPCAWRLLHNGTFLIGSGDVQGLKKPDDTLGCLEGLRVVSASVSPSWQTNLTIESNYLLEVIADSARYETWSAHLEDGYAVFSGGKIALFPPPPRASQASVPS